MASILLSIKPEFAGKIFTGEKRYEFRRRLCQKDIDKIHIYETSPVKKVVGEAEVIGKLQGSIDMVWNRTKEFAGISREGYEQYFEGMETAAAYCLGNVMRYETAKNIEDFGIVRAPQSFVYIEKKTE